VRVYQNRGRSVRSYNRCPHAARIYPSAPQVFATIDRHARRAPASAVVLRLLCGVSGVGCRGRWVSFKERVVNIFVARRAWLLCLLTVLLQPSTISAAPTAQS